MAIKTNAEPRLWTEASILPHIDCWVATARAALAAARGES